MNYDISRETQIERKIGEYIVENHLYTVQQYCSIE